MKVVPPAAAEVTSAHPPATPWLYRGRASLHLPCWGMAHCLPHPQVLLSLIPLQVLPLLKAFIAFKLT